MLVVFLWNIYIHLDWLYSVNAGHNNIMYLYNYVSDVEMIRINILKYARGRYVTRYDIGFILLTVTNLIIGN